MTHNEIVQEQVHHEIAALLNELVGGPERCLVIPNVAWLDRSSLGMLEALYRHFPDSAPRLVLGFDPSSRAEHDENGVLWQYPQVTLRSFVHGFHSVAGFGTLDFAGPNAGRTAGEGRRGEDGGRWVDPLDNDLEWWAWCILQETVGTPPPEACERVMAAIERCFEVFDFRGVLILGMELLGHQPVLAPAIEARLRTLVALSAHNRQFTTRGHAGLAEFLERQFRAALALETDPLHRLCLLYRLAVAVGRRQGRVETALDFTDQALEELGRTRAGLAADQAAMQEAWLRNIRGFLWMRRKDLDRAFEEEERALELLEQAESASEVRELEARLSRGVVADNLAELASLVRDEARRERWHRVTQGLLEGRLELPHLICRMWMSFHRAGLRPREALREARAGLLAARKHRDYLLEYFYLAHLGDLHYRLGELGESLDRYREALPFRDLLADSLEIRLPIEVACAAAAARLGDFDRAQGELESLIGGTEGAAERAELLAARGVLAALAGDAKVAEERIDQAIDLAVESGARAALLRVALAAGRACQSLKRPDEARTAFLRALELAEVDSDLPASDWAELLLGLYACGEATAEHLRSAVLVFPDALADDPEAWWRLAELLDWVSQAGEALLGDPDLASAFDTLRRAAAQREDCRERLASLPSLQIAATAAGVGSARGL